MTSRRIDMPDMTHVAPSTPSAYVLQALAVSAAFTPRPRVSSTARRLGLAVSGLPVVFLALDATLKLLQLPPAMEGTTQLGYASHVVLPLGILQVICLVLYVVPRTSVLGAVLWTGYLGGAVATHVRLGNPWLTHILFPVILGGLLWLGLWLRDARVRLLFPFRAEV
jgi:hypothetical protein